jgi:2-(1,2-epoxy-1,2-dihydrophenyl)acetyl-CoA isomerase
VVDDRPTVRSEVVDRVATITLDRPEALNALTVPMKASLLAALRSADRDEAVRSVVLTGAGRAFCAGQDLKERLAPDAAPLEVEVRQRYNPIVLAIRGLSKPIVAAVNGVAAGAGASLALAADLRVVSERASVVLAFGRIGLVPDTGLSWLLPRLVGPSRAMELALLDEPVDAAGLERLGLAYRVVPAERLAEEAHEIGVRLAALAPRAVAYAKKAMAHGLEIPFEAALDDEATYQGLAGRTADHGEGIQAFLEKREPRFTGE